MGFWDDVKKESEKYTFKAMTEKEKEKQNAKKLEKQYQKDRLTKLKKDHVPCCPKCKSTSITYVNKKLSLGRAAIGGITFGQVGAAVGSMTSKKGKVKCLNCGHTWKL